MSQILVVAALVPWILVTPPDPAPSVRRPVPPALRREIVLTPQAVPADLATDVLEELDAALAVRCVELSRSRADPWEGTVSDSADADPAWRRRLARAARRLPPGECRQGAGTPATIRLVRVESLDPGRASALELDFAGSCVRFTRRGSVVATRVMADQAPRLLALVRELLPGAGQAASAEPASSVGAGEAAGR